MSSGYTPPPPPASVASGAGYPPAPAPPVSTKKIVWIVIAAALVVMLLVLLFVGVVGYAIFASIKSSTPYQHAVELAVHDPRVGAALGAPVKTGWLPSGSINVSGDSGSADLTIRLEGTAHKGRLYVSAKKAEGEWSYRTIAVRTDDDMQRIDLLHPSDALPRER